MTVPEGRVNALRSSCGILLAQAPRWSTGPGLTTVMRTSSQRCGIYIRITVNSSSFTTIIIISSSSNTTFRSLSENSASYLADDCRLVADDRRLRSTESWTCVVTRTHSTFDDTAFAAAGPGLWSSLPPHLRDADLPYSRFRRSLKTFSFGQWV